MDPSAFERTPVNRWLGFRLVSRSAQRVELEQDVREEMLQEAGVVQGGLLTALADTADKFQRRFRAVEESFDYDLSGQSLEAMEAAWQRAKHAERR